MKLAKNCIHWKHGKECFKGQINSSEKNEACCHKNYYMQSFIELYLPRQLPHPRDEGYHLRASCPGCGSAC